MAPSTAAAGHGCGAGFDLEEARQRITAGYSKFLRRPRLSDLVEQRPAFGVGDGTCSPPGCYAAGQQSGSIGTSGDSTGVGADGGGWPTMMM